MPQRQKTWWQHWVSVTAAAALAATALDAVLLQRRRSFFTGGFLSVDHVTNLSQTVTFFVVSLLTDVSVLGIAVALLLWVSGQLRLERRVGIAVTLLLVLVPVVTADVVAYQLLTYFGDAFDLGLLFDLTGRNLGEVFAVVGAHLVNLAWAAGGAVSIIAAIVWTLRRRRFQAIGSVKLPLLQVLALSTSMLVLGAVGTAALRSSSDVLDNGLRRKPTGQLLDTVIRVASDVDGDGFGILGRPPDPDLMDSRVHPYAVDLPGNGVDEDGLAGDLPADVEAHREREGQGAPWRSKPDVVLIVLESFRADAVGAMLAGQPVTPVLDALAARGVASRHAYSHNGYTIQSRRHIFSGSVAGLGDGSTLLDDFKANGYETAYFSAQDESFGGAAQGVGFERAEVSYDARVDRELRYSSFTTAGSLAVPYEVIGSRVAAFLNTRRTGRPLFLYVNFHDTHFPYYHRGIRPLLTKTVVARAEISPGHAGALREMYLNTAANVDHAIGDVLAQARQSLGREPGVVVLADHGESLFDEGFLGHGYALNDAQTRIPLIVANLPLSIEEPFGQSDLRHILRRALETTPGGVSGPTIERNEPRSVFQYLGNIERPAQIGLIATGGRLVYDLRARHVRFDSRDWQSPDDLAPGEERQWLQLVWMWERMMLARQAAKSGEH